ncbi:MAG: OmpA family protein [Campylobacterota bacterium]|nr:OmpA family protein [Campylobacterota bacterium]
MLKYFIIMILIISNLLSAENTIKAEQKNIVTEEINKEQLDDDNDGIANINDECPNTPSGVCIDGKGCTQIIRRVINFNTESFKINKNQTDTLNDIIEIAKECYGYKIKIEGHTDSIANEKYNNILSKQRALTIQKIFILHNIDKKRLSSSWFGESKPLSTNVTDDGRSKNRRVEVIFK